MIPKFTWEGKEQTLVTKARRLTLSDVKTWPSGVCGVSALEQTSVSRNRLMTHGHSNYKKGASVQWGKDSHFNNRFWGRDTSIWKKSTFCTPTSNSHKIKSGWIMDSCVKSDK